MIAVREKFGKTGLPRQAPTPLKTNDRVVRASHPSRRPNVPRHSNDALSSHRSAPYDERFAPLANATLLSPCFPGAVLRFSRPVRRPIRRPANYGAAAFPREDRRRAGSGIINVNVRTFPGNLPWEIIPNDPNIPIPPWLIFAPLSGRTSGGATPGSDTTFISIDFNSFQPGEQREFAVTFRVADPFYQSFDLGQLFSSDLTIIASLRIPGDRPTPLADPLFLSAPYWREHPAG